MPSRIPITSTPSNTRAPRRRPRAPRRPRPSRGLADSGASAAQIELDLPPGRRRARRIERLPAARRLVLPPEVFETAGAAGSTTAPRSGRMRRLVEPVVTVLATIGFGLGWAAVERAWVDPTPAAYPLEVRALFEAAGLDSSAGSGAAALDDAGKAIRDGLVGAAAPREAHEGPWARQRIDSVAGERPGGRSSR